MGLQDDNFSDDDEIGAMPSSEHEPGATSSDVTASPAEDEGVEDLTSVARDLVDAGLAESGASPADDTEEGKVEADPGDAKASEVPDGEEDYSDLPFNQHPRFRALIGQRNDLRTERDNLRGDAQRYQNVEKFMQDNELSGDEVARGFDIMALAKSDPVACWEALKPWATEVAKAAGAITNPALQAQVTAGELPADVAARLSQQEARIAAGERREATRRAQQAQSEMHGTVTNWQAEREERDPNFGTKVHALQREVAFMQQREGRPNTPQGVRDQLDRAYAAVNSGLAPAPAADPRKPAAQPLPRSTTAPSDKPGGVMGIIDARLSG